MRRQTASILIFMMLSSMIVSSCGPLPADEKALPSYQTSTPALLTNRPSLISTSSTFVIYSQKTEGTYRIYIQLPRVYNQDHYQSYPVLFLLDGDWYFDGTSPRISGTGVKGMVSELVDSGKIPPCILVGIGYVGENRRYEFTWNYNLFHQFLVEELVPKIDTNFRTNTSAGRTLIGHSDGAYFSLYTLFVSEAENWPFHNFIVVSGDYTKNGRHIFNEENHFNERIGTQNNLNINLFMAVGGDEEGRFVDSNKELATVISSREYKGFRFTSHTKPGYNHSSILLPTLKEGLQWVFEE